MHLCTFTKFRSLISALLLVFFTISNVFFPHSQAIAQIVSSSPVVLPPVGQLIPLSLNYSPVLIKGMKFFPDDPYRLAFYLDSGNETYRSDSFEQDNTNLFNYFLAALTVPDEDLWVNLSPHESDRIIPESFGMTEMGRDLLAQDYLLKQISASLMHPDSLSSDELEMIGDELISKVWVVPEKAEVYSVGNSVYVTDSKLKVMTDLDYKSMNGLEGEDETQQNKIIRDVIIPKLEKEVNSGRNFAKLRQIYNSLILAAWYKNKINADDELGSYVNRNKISGLEIEDTGESKKIYSKYVEAYKTGVVNLIKEEYDPQTQNIINRRYFSGGKEFINISKILEEKTSGSDFAMIDSEGDVIEVSVKLHDPYKEKIDFIKRVLGDDKFEKIRKHFKKYLEEQDLLRLENDEEGILNKSGQLKDAETVIEVINIKFYRNMASSNNKLGNLYSLINNHGLKLKSGNKVPVFIAYAFGFISQEIWIKSKNIKKNRNDLTDKQKLEAKRVIALYLKSEDETRADIGLESLFDDEGKIRDADLLKEVIDYKKIKRFSGKDGVAKVIPSIQELKLEKGVNSIDFFRKLVFELGFVSKKVWQDYLDSKNDLLNMSKEFRDRAYSALKVYLENEDSKRKEMQKEGVLDDQGKMNSIKNIEEILSLKYMGESKLGEKAVYYIGAYCQKRKIFINM